MKPRLLRSIAVLALGAAAAHAAGGVTVSRSQEHAIEIGMSASEVQRILGRPAERFKYPGAPGPSWRYHVTGASYDTTEFDVDFGSDSKVISAREYWRPNGG